PCNVGLEVHGVEAEVLEPVVGTRISGAQRLVRPRARDVDVHAAVLALASDEAIAEDAGLVAQDLESEGVHVPVGGLSRIGGFQVYVVDAIRHAWLLPRGWW